MTIKMITMNAYLFIIILSPFCKPNSLQCPHPGDTNLSQKLLAAQPHLLS